MSNFMLTFAPFRTPFNLHSERLDSSTNHLWHHIASMPAVAQYFEVSEAEWANGYGSLEHDALPLFFFPIAKLQLKADRIAEFNQQLSTEDVTLSKLEIMIYDDTVAIAIGHWDDSEQTSTLINSEQLDQYFTNVKSRLLENLLIHAFKPCITQLNSTTDQPLFRRPQTFNIYRDIQHHTKFPTEPMWVARTRVGSTSTLPQQWITWAGGTAESLQDIGDSTVFIGSGNSLFLGEDTDDFCRAMCLCQYYAAILSLYQRMLTLDLEKMQQVLGKKDIAKLRQELLAEVQHKLDHLDFVRLKHDQALYGIQGQRRSIVKLIHDAWQTQAQFDNVMGWAELLNDRINRLFQAKQLRQNRLIQSLLAFIGGLTVVDLALTLHDSGQNHVDEGVPGLLDVIGSLPIDGILYAAITFIFAIVFLVYRQQE